MKGNHPKTIPELCTLIWQLEDRHKLLDMEISAVKIWQACRMHVYYKLAEDCGLYEPPHVAHTNKRSRLPQLMTFARSLFLDNPFRGAEPTEIAIFDHTRSNRVGDQIADIYSCFLCDELRELDKDFTIFERPFLHRYTKDHDYKRRRAGLIDSLSSVLAHLPGPRVDPAELKMIRNIEAEIASDLGVKLNLENIFSKQIKRFKLRRYLYGRLLEKYRVKKVYLVVSYFLAPLIDAAKQRGIPVLELQHGVINRYHLGYSFPGREHGSLAYFPDSLLTWGGNWPSTRHLPLAPAATIDYGFKFFEQNKIQYAAVEKKPRKVLVVSQSVHGNALAKYLLENLDALSGYDIAYKLHPSEFNRYKDYSDLSRLVASAANVEIIEGGDVHSLLAESEIVIGVFSTVLFEALEYNCEVFVCLLSGWEYMDEMIDSGHVFPFSELGSHRDNNLTESAK